MLDIPTGWEPRRNLAVRALRVAFADFSAALWQGFEKSERGHNSSSLFQPQAAVVAVAVQVLLSAEDVSRKALCEYRFNQCGTGDSPAAVVLLLDIPTGWEPRAKQQPTGLIAYGAARRRPVQVLFRTEKEKPVHIVYWFFLVRVVIQNFSKTIVVQFVFKVIG